MLVNKSTFPIFVSGKVYTLISISYGGGRCCLEKVDNFLWVNISRHFLNLFDSFYTNSYHYIFQTTPWWRWFYCQITVTWYTLAMAVKSKLLNIYLKLCQNLGFDKGIPFIVFLQFYCFHWLSIVLHYWQTIVQ